MYWHITVYKADAVKAVQQHYSDLEVLHLLQIRLAHAVHVNSTE